MQLFLTGVTGFLGGEILVEIAKRKDIEKIYCLVRAQSEDKALEKLKMIFNLHGDYFDSNKVFPIVGELADDNFAEVLIGNENLKNVDTIIHSAANTSFSKIYDDVVERVNIGGTRQMLRWAQSLKHLNLFTYIGTASICGSTVHDTLVLEDMSPNISAKHLVKYSYTKMIGEMMLKEYLPEEKILVVRPSVVMGDTRSWVPRSFVILWAMATFKQLRLFPMDKQSKIDIIPIDYAARAIIELVINNHRKYSVYHVSSGLTSETNVEKLTDAIRDYSPDLPDFKFVSKDMLGNLKKWSKNSSIVDVQDPLFKYKEYLDYWVNKFGDNTKLRILFYALEPYIEFIELSQIFDNSRLLEDTNILPSVPAHIYIPNSAKHFDSINIFEGAINP